MAASEPMAPMAMPISARRSTGASLMPSPTKASLAPDGFFSSCSSTFATLSAGRSWLYTWSTPRSAATRSATAPASPVSMTVLSTPAAFSCRMASLAVGFSTSEMTMWPMYAPSIAMWMMVPTLRQGMQVMPRRSISLSFPAATVWPSTAAVTPSPLISRISVTRLRSNSFPQACRRLLLMGWLEALSARAAYSSSFSFSIRLWWMPLTAKTPRVRVPVLSNMTIFVRDRVSR